ncbi:hypothetical protein EV401DRAFT_1968817, partial [Pisolithus croceorrhizus]
MPRGVEVAWVLQLVACCSSRFRAQVAGISSMVYVPHCTLVHKLCRTFSMWNRGFGTHPWGIRHVCGMHLIEYPVACPEMLSTGSRALELISGASSALAHSSDCCESVALSSTSSRLSSTCHASTTSVLGFMRPAMVSAQSIGLSGEFPSSLGELPDPLLLLQVLGALSSVAYCSDGTWHCCAASLTMSALGIRP